MGTSLQELIAERDAIDAAAAAARALDPEWLARQQWLEQRRRFICGSDIAGTLDIYPETWGATRARPQSVWRSKVLPLAQQPDIGNEVMWWGSACEDAAIRHFMESDRTDTAGWRSGGTRYQAHWKQMAENGATLTPNKDLIAGRGRVAATPDGIIRDANGERLAGLQVKVSSFPEGPKDEFRLPVHYHAQCLHEATALDVDFVILHAWYGGKPRTPSANWIIPTPAEHRAICQAWADHWWKAHVDTGWTPPDERPTHPLAQQLLELLIPSNVDTFDDALALSFYASLESDL